MSGCDLRCACIVLGALGVGLHIYVFLFVSSQNLTAIVALILGLVAPLALLFGAINEDECLVLVALIIYLLNLLFLVFALLGAIFNFKGCQDSGPSAISLLFYIIASCVIYAYYNELQN